MPSWPRRFPSSRCTSFRSSWSTGPTCSACARIPVSAGRSGISKTGTGGARPSSRLFGDANLLESVEDEVEAELERAHVAVRAVREMLFTVLVQVRVHVDGD